MPPLFFAKFSKILRKIRNFPANCRQITSKLKYNYLIFNKIKFLFFLLKSVAIIKKVVYLQCQTTTTITMETIEKQYRIKEMTSHMESEAMPKISKNQDIFREAAKRYFETIVENPVEYQAFMHSDARGIVMRIGKFVMENK